MYSPFDDWEVHGWALKSCSKDYSFKTNRVNSNKTRWNSNCIQVNESKAVTGTMSSILGLEHKHNDSLINI